jgi:hypothetical protein
LHQALYPLILTFVDQLGGANPLVPPFGEWGQQVSKETTNRSFDELARAVAEGSLSRRRALKLFAGTAIAALIPSRALADGRRRRRRNHHDDDECFVRICHVPFNHEKGKCDWANAETLFVRRRERRRHLKNHHCDRKGKCPPSKTSSSTTTGTPTTTTTTAGTPTTTTTTAGTPTTTTTTAGTPTTTTTTVGTPTTTTTTSGRPQ